MLCGTATLRPENFTQDGLVAQAFGRELLYYSERPSSALTGVYAASLIDPMAPALDTEVLPLAPSQNFNDLAVFPSAQGNTLLAASAGDQPEGAQDAIEVFDISSSSTPLSWGRYLAMTDNLLTGVSNPQPGDMAAADGGGYFYAMLVQPQIVVELWAADFAVYSTTRVDLPPGGTLDHIVFADGMVYVARGDGSIETLTSPSPVRLNPLTTALQITSLARIPDGGGLGNSLVLVGDRAGEVYSFPAGGPPTALTPFLTTRGSGEVYAILASQGALYVRTTDQIAMPPREVLEVWSSLGETYYGSIEVADPGDGTWPGRFRLTASASRPEVIYASGGGGRLTVFNAATCLP